MEKKVVKVNLTGVVLQIARVQVVRMKVNIKIYVNGLSKSMFNSFTQIDESNN